MKESFYSPVLETHPCIPVCRRLSSLPCHPHCNVFEHFGPIAFERSQSQVERGTGAKSERNYGSGTNLGKKFCKRHCPSRPTERRRLLSAASPVCLTEHFIGTFWSELRLVYCCNGSWCNASATVGWLPLNAAISHCRKSRDIGKCKAYRLPLGVLDNPDWYTWC